MGLPGDKNPPRKVCVGGGGGDLLGGAVGSAHWEGKLEIRGEPWISCMQIFSSRSGVEDSPISNPGVRKVGGGGVVHTSPGWAPGLRADHTSAARFPFSHTGSNM